MYADTAIRRADEYISARRFLESLAYEARVPAI
jgi:hypothetical protein